MRAQRLPLTSGHDLLQTLNIGRDKTYTGVSIFNAYLQRFGSSLIFNLLQHHS
jgi:hypothetical protein